MKKSALVSIISMVALCGWSCSKDDRSPVEFNPDIEISFVNPVDVSFSGSSVSPRPTKAAGDYEVLLTDVALFVVPADGTNTGTVIYKSQFTAAELNSKKKVFSVNDLTANGTITDRTTFDFYAVANGGQTLYDAVILNSTTETGLKDLLVEDYAAPVGSYNGVYNNVLNGTGLRASGMIMAGVKRESLSPANSLTPTKPSIALLRTLSKLELEAYTTKTGDVDPTESFEERYPGSSIKVVSAKITNLIPGTTVLDQGVKNLKTPSMGDTPGAWGGSDQVTLTQVPSHTGFVTGAASSAKNLFYTYPNGGRDADKPLIDYKPQLELTTRFYFDASDATGTEVVYKIPLAGALGGSLTEDPNDGGEFGLFVRNGQYKVVLRISGLTSTEVVADVSVAPWDGVVTQTVDIGS